MKKYDLEDEYTKDRFIRLTDETMSEQTTVDVYETCIFIDHSSNARYDYYGKHFVTTLVADDIDKLISLLNEAKRISNKDGEV